MNPIAGNSDTFSKAFNSLYTNVRFLSNNPPIRSLVVGSAAFGDGKTTIALNLALAAAAVGQRVLVVDANLRDPRLHNLIGLSNSAGLSEALIGSVSLDQVVQSCSQDRNLFFLSAGQALSDAIRLLASTNMKNLSQELVSRFDLVIFDSSNLSEFSDTTFLATQTDGLLITAGVGKTRRTILTQALAELNRLQVPVLGMIANHTARNVSASYAQSSQSQSQEQEQQSILEDLGILKPELPTSTKR